MIIAIEPVPKPRMVKSDRWRGRPAVTRYWAFCDELRLKWGRRDVPDRMVLKFSITMPKSWSAKKRLEMGGKPHQQRPDIDNLLKSFLDALCEDDSYIYDVRVEKYWAEQGSIEVVEP